jgi:hypothetical protein
MVGLKSGRTIGEKREKLETASERAATHKKNKRQKIKFPTFYLRFIKKFTVEALQSI